MELEPKQRILVPLDVPTVQEADGLVEELAPFVGGFKIGLEFIYANIAQLLLSPSEKAVSLLNQLRALARRLASQRVLWDGKFADIPNTVENASIAVSKMGVMFNVHASCGRESVRAAVKAKGSSLVFGVTVLTSIDSGECRSIFGTEPGNKVLEFAQMLEEEQAAGIICSPQELDFLREFSLIKATPGVRPRWAAKGDQSRITTPADAVRKGADFLIIGRPIRKPPADIGGRARAARIIAEEIKAALSDLEGERRD